MRASSLLAALGIALAAALPVVASRLRGPGAPRCDRDGTALVGTLRIRAESVEASATFCSVRCAADWLARSGPGWQVVVGDEATGREVPAADAWFVRSRVVASPATGERIHAFALRADAESHAALYGGRLLVGADHPFARDAEREAVR